MTWLPDVNALVAVAWPEHVFHDRAVRWLDAVADDGWATCPVTESGFLRMSANPAVVGEAVRVTEAASLLAQLSSVGVHRFIIDDIQPSAAVEFLAEQCTGHRQVTDAHILALAIRRKLVVATFDRGFVQFGRGTGAVELIGERTV